MGAGSKPYVVSELIGPEMVRFDPSDFLEREAPARIRAIVHGYLDPLHEPGRESGARAAEFLEHRLQDWVDSGACNECRAPIRGMYDLGAIRRCTSNWLLECATLFENRKPIDAAAKQLVEASRRWELFNSVRSMHDRMDEQPSETREFLSKKIGSFPSMVREAVAAKVAAARMLQCL